MFAYQCCSCGRATTSWIKRTSISAPDELPAWDADLQSRYDDQNRALVFDDRNKERDARRRRYNEYLLSPKWRSIRSRVLQRSRGLCEGCREVEPTQVHHLTYDHLGDELLFELVALCDWCHNKAHSVTERE